MAGLFEEVLGSESNPLREFMSGIGTKSPDPLGLGTQQGSQWFAPLSPMQIGSAPTFDFWTPFQASGSGALAQRAAAVTPAKPAPKPQGPIARAQAAAAAPAQGTPGTSGAVGDTDLKVDTASPHYNRAIQIASEEGLDPTIFTRLIARESTYNPNAVSPAGAQGLTQLMPETARELGVTNSFDPEQSLRGGARYLKQMLTRYGGDYNKALAAYHDGPGNVDSYGSGAPPQKTQAYVRSIQGQKATAPQEYPAAATAPPPPAGVRPLKGITIAQYGDEGLATGAADYICGVIAAKAFRASQGREPTLREALDLARQLGVIDPNNGMHGVESTAHLIRKLGGYATVGKVDKKQIIAEIQAGRPVIIDTDAGSRGHYFVIEGYDPATDTFDFGNSARALRASGGNSMYKLENISSLGFGSPGAAIYSR